MKPYFIKTYTVLMASTVMVLIIVPALYTILGDLGLSSVKGGEETEIPDKDRAGEREPVFSA